MNRLSDAHRIAIIVDQPWQGELGIKIANQILRRDPNSEVSIIFSDYYSFFLRSDYMLGLKSAFQGKIFTQEELFINWQRDSAETEYSECFLAEWEQKTCNVRNLETLIRTNQWLFGDERDKYQKPLSEKWKRKILYDTINWCESLIEEIRPAIVVSIERCTLPTNLLYEITKREGLRFLTLIPSRIGTRWIVNSDLSYGMSEEQYLAIVNRYSNEDSIQAASEFISQLISTRQGGYFSPSHKITEEMQMKKRKAITTHMYELRRICGRIYGRVFIQPKERSVKSKRVREDLVALTFVDIQSIAIRCLRTLGFKFWGKTTVPSKPYFLWALHMRPEGSGLVLGDGRDEIEALLYVAGRLPKGYVLAVKENPEMFGLRRIGFYKQFKSHRQIELVDPLTPTFQLIQNSLGVIGISGTVLMEAAYFNKPSFALGHPEFVRFLSGSGWNNSSEFISNVIQKNYNNVQKQMLKYVAYILDNSFESGVPFEGNLRNHQGEVLESYFAEYVLRQLK